MGRQKEGRGFARNSSGAGVCARKCQPDVQEGRQSGACPSPPFAESSLNSVPSHQVRPSVPLGRAGTRPLCRRPQSCYCFGEHARLLRCHVSNAKGDGPLSLFSETNSSCRGPRAFLASRAQDSARLHPPPPCFPASSIHAFARSSSSGAVEAASLFCARRGLNRHGAPNGFPEVSVLRPPEPVCLCGVRPSEEATSNAPRAHCTYRKINGGSRAVYARRESAEVKRAIEVYERTADKHSFGSVCINARFRMG